jgi:hypothetical protein
MPKFCSLRPCYSLRKTIGVFVKGKWRGIPPKFCTEDTYLVIFHRTFDTTFSIIKEDGEYSRHPLFAVYYFEFTKTCLFFTK